MLVKMVFARLSSFWQCQKTEPKIWLKENCPQCPFDRGWKGLKHIWAMPIWKQETIHFNKGLPENNRESKI